MKVFLRAKRRAIEEEALPNRGRFAARAAPAALRLLCLDASPLARAHCDPLLCDAMRRKRPQCTDGERRLRHSATPCTAMRFYPTTTQRDGTDAMGRDPMHLHKFVAYHCKIKCCYLIL